MIVNDDEKTTSEWEQRRDSGKVEETFNSTLPSFSSLEKNFHHEMSSFTLLSTSPTVRSYMYDRLKNKIQGTCLTLHFSFHV
jgi:hypothetical protein